MFQIIGVRPWAKFVGLACIAVTLGFMPLVLYMRAVLKEKPHVEEPCQDSVTLIAGRAEKPETVTCRPDQAMSRGSDYSNYWVVCTCIRH